MNEDEFDKQPLTPASHEEAAGHAAPQLPETPMNGSGESAPVGQMRGRGKVPRWLLLSLIGVLALAVLAAGLGVWASLGQRQKKLAPTPVATTFHPAPCPFGGVVGVVEGRDVRCGYLVVPQDHSRLGGPTLRLAVAIFKTPTPHPAADPVLWLVGGPGGSGLQSPPGLSSIAASLAEWPRDRDLILLDQRGTGYSQPSLACPELKMVVSAATYIQALRACHDRLVREGVNLNAYTTIQNAADVHDLVRVLGYQQVNLYGTSYGARLALTVMRLFPADLRSVVLDSVLPPQINLYTGHAAADQQAFDTLFRGCGASTACNQKYPHLQAVFAQLVSELKNKPATLHVRDPRTGQLVPWLLTGDDLVAGVRSALYSGDIPKLPALIYQLRNHNYAAFLELNAPGPPDSSISWGMNYSVECGEDIAFTTPQRLQASVRVLAPEYQHAALAGLQQDYEVCQFWGVKPVPSVQKQAVTSAIPTLILSGQYDPAAPPAYGKLAAGTLSKSYFFLFPDASHILLYKSACADSIILAFQESPTKQPDASCLQSLGPPSFE